MIKKFVTLTEDAPDNWSQPSKENARTFFSSTAADLDYFKNAIRNVLMHTREGLYDGPGALSARNRVEEFFQRLPGGIGEHGSTSLLDPSVFG